MKKLTKQQQIEQNKIKSFVNGLDVSTVQVQFGGESVDKNVIVVSEKPTIEPVDNSDKLLDNGTSDNKDEVVDEMKQKVLDLIEELGVEVAYQKLTSVATVSDKKSTTAEQLYLDLYKSNNNLERKDFVKKVVDEMKLMGHNYATTFWQNMRKKHKHNVK